MLGGLDVNVLYEDQNAKLSLLMVERSGSSHFRRDCLASMTQAGLYSDLHGHLPSSGALLSRHGKLFEDGLGTLQGYEAKLYVDPLAMPEFCKPRPVPTTKTGTKKDPGTCTIC